MAKHSTNTNLPIQHDKLHSSNLALRFLMVRISHLHREQQHAVQARTGASPRRRLLRYDKHTCLREGQDGPCGERGRGHFCGCGRCCRQQEQVGGGCGSYGWVYFVFVLEGWKFDCVPLALWGLLYYMIDFAMKLIRSRVTTVTK